MGQLLTVHLTFILVLFTLFAMGCPSLEGCPIKDNKHLS